MAENVNRVAEEDLETSEPTSAELEAQIKTGRALALVNQSYWHFSNYRQKNHDGRWKDADGLYFGMVPQRYWEGTNVPRSSLAAPISFDQVQSALPVIVSTLFGMGGDWFQVDALAGATVEEALQQKAAMRFALEHPIDEYGNNAVNELILAIQSVLQYGTGGICLEYDPASLLPVVEYCDIREIYVDPAANTPSIDSARSVVRRRLMTVEQLLALRTVENMNIPGKAELLQMAASRPVTVGDQTFSMSSAMHGEHYSAADDVLPLPTDRFIEVKIYYSKTKLIWALNETHVALNIPNPFGFIPYVYAPCYQVLGRFYALGIPDVLRGNQRHIEALRNARLDEIALSLNPPRVRKAGQMLSPSQMRLRPGLVNDSADPRKDWVTQFPQNITQDSLTEIQMLQMDSQNRTGINSLMTQGLPMRSNASKTATGITAQQQAPLSRLQAIVSNIENYLIVPLLYKLQRMLEVMATQQQALPGYDEKGTFITVPSSAIGKPVRFKMQAASKMLTREKLSQMFPFIMQYLFSGPFMGELAKTGQTVNFNEIFRMFGDATGVSEAYSLIRPMSEQEQAALNQPSPELQAKIAMKTQDGDVRKEIMDKKMEADLTKAAMGAKTKEMEVGEKSASQILQLLKDSMNAKKQAKDKEFQRQKPPKQESA